MKIIPAIDLMEGKVVRLYKGDPTKKPSTVKTHWKLQKNGSLLVPI